MVLPKITLKTDLETYLEGLPLDRFFDVVKGRVYIQPKVRGYVNKVLSENYGQQLSEQMKIDADYAAVLILKNDPLPETEQTQTQTVCVREFAIA